MKASKIGSVLATVIVATALLAEPAAAAAPPGAVAWVSCDAGIDPLKHTYKPKKHLLSCATAESGLRGLVWSSWTKTSAKATGTYYWNNCEPACFSGKNLTSKATVTLSRPRTQKGARVFTRVRVDYTGENGKAAVEKETSLPWNG